MARPAVLDLRDAGFWQDPYPQLRRAAEQHRVARTAQGDIIVLRADDVDLVQSHPAFAQPGLLSLERLGVSDGPFFAWRALTMAVHDGERHDRLRGTVIRAFTPRRVERLRSTLSAHAGDVLRSASSKETFDVVADYARDLPLWLICEFLGLPQSAATELDDLLTGTEEMFADPLTPQRRARAEDGIVALGGYVEQLVDERRRSPREDLVSDLLEAQAAGRLSYDELVALVVNVLGGAVGSSRAGISNALYELLRHPGQRADVLADRDRLPAAVEECLRFHPPFRLGRRLVVDANDELGVDLAPGSSVVIARQAANRDPTRWHDPDRFDVRRKPERHYSFGYGAHFCLGQALARLDIQEAVWAFFTALPQVALVTERPRRVPFTADEQLEELVVQVPVGTPCR
jgi:cytochrome P450